MTAKTQSKKRDPSQVELDHPLLEKRDVQDLAEAVRALNATLVRDMEARRRQNQEALAVLQSIATHTEGLPALVAALGKRVNGVHDHGAHEDP